MATYRKIKDVSALDPEAMKKKKKKCVIIAAVVAVLLVAAVLVAILASKPETLKTKYTFTVEVTHSDGVVETIEITTTEENLGAALVAEGLVDVEEIDGVSCVVAAGQMGKEEVNREFNGALWALYVGDERTDKDVYQVALENGKTYKLIYTTE